MNQRDLEYIKMIVDEGGISQAARKLFVSQPSLSQSVKRIEESLGTTLFDRTPKGLVLTPEGEEYYRMAGKVLSIYASFENEIQNLHEVKTGKVAVGTTPHRGMVLFPEFLAEFYMKYPGIVVKMVEAPTSELEELLLNGSVDFALLRAPVNQHVERRFIYHGLSKDTFMLILPKGHPAKAYAEDSEDGGWPVLDPKWLGEENFLLPDMSLRLYESVTSILKQAGIDSLRSSYQSIYMETLVHLVGAGAGVAMVSSRYLKGKALMDRIDIYQIPDSYGAFWEISVATRKDGYMSKAAKKFIEEYTDYLG